MFQVEKCRLCCRCPTFVVVHVYNRGKGSKKKCAPAPTLPKLDKEVVVFNSQSCMHNDYNTTKPTDLDPAITAEGKVFSLGDVVFIPCGRRIDKATGEMGLSM